MQHYESSRLEITCRCSMLSRTLLHSPRNSSPVKSCLLTSKETEMTWSDNENEDTTIYKVVVNHEEQYSIWPADRENPLGWNDAGKSGPKAECLAYIKEVWTDMRPLSLRKRMEELANNPQPI